MIVDCARRHGRKVNDCTCACVTGMDTYTANQINSQRVSTCIACSFDVTAISSLIFCSLSSRKIVSIFCTSVRTIIRSHFTSLDITLSAMLSAWKYHTPAYPPRKTPLLYERHALEMGVDCYCCGKVARIRMARQ
jgi:hypothetical protein